MIVAMLTYQSACGCVCQSVWESSSIYLFIISLLNVIIKRQASSYSVGYLPVIFTKVLLEKYKAKYIQKPKVC